MMKKEHYTKHVHYLCLHVVAFKERNQSSKIHLKIVSGYSSDFHKLLRKRYNAELY